MARRLAQSSAEERVPTRASGNIDILSHSFTFRSNHTDQIGDALVASLAALA